MFITAAVDAHEDFYVAIFDIPGEYLHTEIGKDLPTFLEGALSEIMVKVAPKIYEKYVIMISKGKLLLYVQIKKVIVCIGWNYPFSVTIESG